MTDLALQTDVSVDFDGSRLRATVDWYDEHAETYATRFGSVDLAAERGRFVHNLPSVPRPVVDAGCGSGRDCALLAASGVPSIGIDLSWGQVRQATLRTSGPLIRADIRRLPLATGGVRGVWSVGALLHLSANEASMALMEFHRVIVAGGALYLSVRQGSGSEWRGHPRSARWFRLYDPDEISTMAAMCGFDVTDLAVERGVGVGDWVNLHGIRS